MAEPRAYLNGHWIGAAELALSVFDNGFLQGTTIAEQLRTFGGKLFELDAHLDRLFQSLAIIGLEPPVTLQECRARALELAAHNHALLTADDDLGLTMFVTPGIQPANGGPATPTLCMHTLPLRFSHWAGKYVSGESLATTSIEQVPARCWPRELKCRSRMHYFLADREATRTHPGSRALMTDADRHVTEATTANIVLYDPQRGLRTPPLEQVLHGISLGILERLARHLAIPWSYESLTAPDVASSSEVMLTSTSPCVLPVVRFNGSPIGAGHPGPIFKQLLAAWSELVGVDILAQAERYAHR